MPCHWQYGPKMVLGGTGHFARRCRFSHDCSSSMSATCFSLSKRCQRPTQKTKLCRAQTNVVVRHARHRTGHLVTGIALPCVRSTSSERAPRLERAKSTSLRFQRKTHAKHGHGSHPPQAPVRLLNTHDTSQLLFNIHYKKFLTAKPAHQDTISST